MTNSRNTSAVLLLISLFYSSCATICGGSKYYANIIVDRKPNAKIFYQGREVGVGKASVLTKRKDANEFSFSVKEENCEEQQYQFKSRTFRGWSFVGSIFSWNINGIIPVGLLVDLSNGSLWKPNVHEKNVVKQNYKNFKYTVDYTKSCSTPNNSESPENVKTDILYLKNGNIIKGSIIERIPQKSIQIRVSDGDILLFSFDEIDRVE